ncbi:MAG: type II toxin-antitoxin system HicA family toxin, partial [Gammaproteobacteria bacterium]
MTALPSVTGKDLLAALKEGGFEVVRVKGNHHFLRHADGRNYGRSRARRRNSRPRTPFK